MKARLGWVVKTFRGWTFAECPSCGVECDELWQMVDHEESRGDCRRVIAGVAQEQLELF